MKAIAKRTAMFAVACLMIRVRGGNKSLPEKEVQAASGYTGYIKSATTSLKRSKSKKSKTLARIKRERKSPFIIQAVAGGRFPYKGKKGFVPKKRVKISTKAPKLKGSKKTKGKTVASFAKRFVGNPYRWGGTNLNTGADCSGFTKAVTVLLDIISREFPPLREERGKRFLIRRNSRDI